MKKNITKLNLPVLMLLMFVLTACSMFNNGVDKNADGVVEQWPGILQGYMAREALPNSVNLIPPAPTKGSARFLLDQAISEQSLKLRGTPRWNLAIADTELKFPKAADTFSCALNAPISEQKTPNLYMLLRRTIADPGLATSAAKTKYQRTRPFVINKQASCTPDDEHYLKKDGSYPSGHAAIGWMWSLVLSDLAPERADQLMARGRAFAQSRVICNVHWQSDVNEGRAIGTATYVKLQSNAEFRETLKKARIELASVHAEGLAPNGDCDAQTKALAIVADQETSFGE